MFKLSMNIQPCYKLKKKNGVCDGIADRSLTIEVLAGVAIIL